MKIIAVDNYASDAVADVLVAENITNASYAEAMCSALIERYCQSDFAPRFYRIVADDYRLSRGMEDMI